LLSHADIEERFTQTRSELQALIQISFGGMVAEEIFFGETSSGVAGDLQAATNAACYMVGNLGMGSTLASAAVVGGSVAARVMASDEGRQEVEELLRRAKTDASDMLKETSHIVEALRDALLERNELVGDEIRDVIVGAGLGAVIEQTTAVRRPTSAPPASR
jgi:ATP-dependent Zn protease